jgi:hypothetical protein
MVTIVLTRVRPIPPRVLSRMLSGSFFPVFRAEGLDMALKEYPAKSQVPIQVPRRNPSGRAVRDTAQRPLSEGGL